MLHRLAAAAVTVLALAGLAAPAGADTSDPPTAACASWGCAAVDIDLIAGGQRVTWAVADAGPPDGRCVYLYVQSLAGGWWLAASSCGPTVTGTVTLSSGYIAPTVRITRGPWPGANYFTLYNSMV